MTPRPTDLSRSPPRADAGGRLGDADSEDGDQSPRLQRALCRQLEQLEIAQLDAELRLLPPITLVGFGLIPDPASHPGRRCARLAAAS